MTEQEAIKILKGSTTVIIPNEHSNKTNLEALETVLEALEKQIKDRWIPVTEKLPEVITGFFIVCLKNGAVLTANYNSFSKSFKEISSMGITSFYEDNPVIAWRNLPEPYKGE